MNIEHEIKQITIRGLRQLIEEKLQTIENLIIPGCSREALHDSKILLKEISELIDKLIDL